MIQDSQLTIRGSATYLPEDFADAMRLLSDGSVVVDEMVTSLRPLAEAAGAFDDAFEGRQAVGAIDGDVKERRLLFLERERNRVTGPFERAPAFIVEGSARQEFLQACTYGSTIAEGRRGREIRPRGVSRQISEDEAQRIAGLGAQYGRPSGHACEPCCNR